MNPVKLISESLGYDVYHPVLGIVSSKTSTSIRAEVEEKLRSPNRGVDCWTLSVIHNPKFINFDLDHTEP